jgi:hypothetical protein
MYLVSFFFCFCNLSVLDKNWHSVNQKIDTFMLQGRQLFNFQPCRSHILCSCSASFSLNNKGLIALKRYLKKLKYKSNNNFFLKQVRTHQGGNSVHTHKCNFWTQSVISTSTSVNAKCDFHTQSEISTHRVISRMTYTRRVWFIHIFIHAESDFHTQSEISKRRVELPHAVWLWHAQM